MSTATHELASRRQQRRAELASRRRHPSGRDVVRVGPLPVSYYVIAIVMAVYLITSLGTSLFMNWYNARAAIKER